MTINNLPALILAAGRGERMKPLTDAMPKPLLRVSGKPLIEWHLEALARAGIREVVINAAWLEDQLPAALGNGARWGLRIRYSMEGRDHGGALETAGGIAKALPLLASDAFWLVSGDIFAPGFAFAAEAARSFAEGDDLGRLWLVPNPPFNVTGDFALDGQGRLTRDADRPWTYANLALFRATIVDGVVPGSRAQLGPRLFDAAAAGLLAGEPWPGRWHNLGTPAQLDALNAALAAARTKPGTPARPAA